MSNEKDRTAGRDSVQFEGIVMLLWQTGKELWRSALHVAPYEPELYDKMSNPEIGDLVFECSTFSSTVTPEKAQTMIGYLVEKGGFGEYKIKRLDNGEIAEWTNSEFLKLPIPKEA